MNEGLIFGRWVIMEDLGVCGRGGRKFKVKCVCGIERDIFWHTLKSGASKSCGCLLTEILSLRKKHGKTKTNIYHVWSTMKSRCHNEKNQAYKYYGGRGIRVYYKWLLDFREFDKWAMKNGFKIGLQLDRKDNNKGYYPNNCRFVTQIVNIRNRSNTIFIEIEGVKKRMVEWAEIYELNYNTLQDRLNAGWTGKDLLKKGRAKRKNIK